MPGLKSTIAEPETIAPYGLRHGSFSAKGKGYFGELPTPDGSMATELSSEAEGIGEHPLIVPTLTKAELKHLTSGGEPTEQIYQKAESWARQRQKQGKSPFASPSDLRHPVPEFKKGGKVSASSRADGIAKRGKTRGKMY